MISNQLIKTVVNYPDIEETMDKEDDERARVLGLQ